MNLIQSGGLRQYFRKVLLTCVEIAETQTSYRVHVIGYICILVIQYCQVISNTYNFSELDNVILDVFNTTIKVLSIYYLFQYIESQIAIWILFTFINLMLWLVLALILWLGYLKYKEQQMKLKTNALVKLSKELLNTFFTAYIMIFFGPISKMNIAIMITGKNSLIVEERKNEGGLNTSFNLFVGLLGLIVSFTLVGIALYFFRDYEYNDQNIFKRRYSYSACSNLVIRLILICFDLLDVHVGLKLTLGIIFAILAVYDSIIVRPYENIVLAQAFIAISTVYLLIEILIPFLDSGKIVVQSFTYMTIWLGPLVVDLALTYYHRIRINTLHYMEETVSQDYNQFSLFSELVIQLTQVSSKDDEAKLLLHQLFRFHTLNCKTAGCFSQFIDKPNYPNQQYSQETLIQLIDQMFKVTMNHPRVMQDSSSYENLSLKYISFIQKYADNNLLSFFLLKKLANNKVRLSYYFSLLFEVQSDKLQDLMKMKINSMDGISSDARNGGMKNFMDGIQQIEEIAQEFTNRLIKILTLKHSMWQQLILQSNSMDDLMNRIISKLKRLLSLREDLLQLFEFTFGSDHHISLRNNAGYQKISQLYQMFVMNDVVEVSKIEQAISDLKKRDQYKDENFLNNTNYMAAQSVIVQAGLSRENGKILNRHNQKIQQFFGYNPTDWERIQKINDLMPQHVASVHNQILAQYFQKGYSSIMLTNKKVISSSLQQIYLLNQQTYLFPVTIRINNDFLTLDDCVFNVTLLKIPSNRELIMFDEYGKIIGFSKHLVEVLSQSSHFNYNEILLNGYIQLLCPSIVPIFETLSDELKTNKIKEESSNTYTQNLQTMLLIVQNYSELHMAFKQYSKGFEKSLMTLRKKKGLHLINQFLQTQKHQFNQDQLYSKLKLKFNLQSFFRSFANLDEKIYLSISSNNTQREKNLRYFVIECVEVIKVGLKGFGVKVQQETVTNQTLISTNNVYEDDFDNVEVSSIKESEPQRISENLQQVADDYSRLYLEERKPYQNSQKEEINFASLENTKQFGLTSNINSPMSQKSQEEFLLKDMTEIDVSKKSFLIKMFSHQQKQAFKTNPNIFNKRMIDFDEEWPKELDDNSQFQRNSNILEKQRFSRIEIIDKDKDNQNYEASNAVPSENDDEDRNSGGRKKDKNQELQNQNAKKLARFQQDMSSQQSKSSQVSFSVSGMFLEKKMPKKYFLFTVTTYALFVVISICTIVQIVISTSGFEVIGKFNHQVDTAYTLQSSYVKSVMGVVLQFLQSQGTLTRNFSIPFNQQKLFKQFQNNGVIQFIDLIQQRFELLRMTQTQIENFDVIQFYDRIAEHINSLVLVDNTNIFYSLIQGLSPNFQITSTMQVIIQDQLKYLQQTLLDNFFLVFYISLVLVLLLIILLFVTYATFLRFQEKIILIVTRLSTVEFERELNKLEYAKSFLKDIKGTYIVTNDIVPQYLYYRSNGLQNIDKNIDQDLTEKQYQNQEQLSKDSKANNPGVGQILSSKIYNPQLSVKSHLIQYLALAITVIAFLIGSIVFALQTPQQCQSISNYYLDYSKLFATIQQVMIWTEIKAVQPFLFHHPDEIGQTDYHSLEATYNSWLDNIQYQTTQEQIFQVHYENNQEILDLLYSDMCGVTNFLENTPNFRKLCRTHFKGYYKTGITGFIKQLMILFYSFQVQIDTQTYTSPESALAFMSLTENWALLILFPNSFGPAIDTALNLIQGQLITVTAQLGNNLLVYLIASGISINILLVCYFYTHFKDLNDRIQSVEYLLTMVPYEKLQEQTINQMIKQITIY